MRAATERRPKRFSTAGRLMLGLVLLVAVGTGALLLPGMTTGSALSLNEAIFTAVSALTVTGLSLIPVSTELSLMGKIVLLLLIQTGGVGYMVLAVLVFRLLGRSISMADRMGLQDSLGLVSGRGILLLTRQVVLTVLVIQFLGACAFWLHWRGVLGDGEAVFFSIFHAVSSFCNAGFDLFSGDPRFPGGFPTDNGTLAIAGTLIVLGGLGIPVLFDILTYPWNKRLSLHTRITFIVVAGLIIGGALLILLGEARPGRVLDDQPLERQIALSFFQSISARTAGFVGMPRFDSLDSATQLVLMGLMFIGCAPASMGGGITTGTFIILILAVGAYARGQSTPIVGGRAIPGEMVRKAASVLTLSLIVTATATWLILLTHPISMQQAAFEVVSAFATCGLSLALTTELNGFGQAVIMVVMLWGRLGALTVLFAFTRTGPPGRLRYPEEKILIG
ncbi:MAG: hypothetical protein MH204_04610 [Fimbriimonadaceae bacterium]|nr:hypothetical protein [Fimbriimonadaceae bacterium]